MTIFVTPDGLASWSGPGGRTAGVRCAIGPGGVTIKTGEGDGVTPLGTFPLRRVFYRPDRVEKPVTGLPLVALEENHGWCDEPTHAAYNTLISRPFPASHETLWREDGVYDVIVELGYNDDPVIAGHGSAIFIHIAHPDYRPTQGCVALAKADLLDLLAGCKDGDMLVIGG